MPFERTVDVLLHLIAEREGADIAALSSGESVQENFRKSVSIPLQAGPKGQMLFLAWRQAEGTSDGSNSAPLIDALRLIVERSSLETRLHQLLADAASLQWRLADSKIADRTAGLIASGEANLLDVRQHVYKVLASVDDVNAASVRIQKLKAELEDREKISSAKIMLQRRYAFTEEQAYVHLQQASRRQRRTIAEIAVEICQEEEAGAVR